MDLEQIRRNYENFSDLEIEAIAKHGSRGMNAAVIPILEKELQKRGISTSIMKHVKAEAPSLSTNEIENFKQTICSLGCLICKNTTTKIKAYRFEQVTSFIWGGDIERDEKFCCINCYKRLRDKSLRKTILLGWWSGKGLFSTPICIAFNLYNRFTHRVEEIDSHITYKFLNEHRGKIRLAKNKETVLRQFVRKMNASFE